DALDEQAKALFRQPQGLFDALVCHAVGGRLLQIAGGGSIDVAASRSSVMARRAPTATERRYAHTVGRIMPLAAVVGFGMATAAAVALRDQPRSGIVSVVSFASMMVFPILVTRKMTAWGATRCELARLVVSITASVLTNHYTGWPMPTWLWLPYNGLAM